MQAQDAAQQPGHLHPAAGPDAAGALRQQARRTAACAAAARADAMAPRRHSPHVRMHEPDRLLLDLQAPDAACHLCALPQPPRRQGALVLQGCKGELSRSLSTSLILTQSSKSLWM